MQQQWWGSLVYKKKVPKKSPAKLLAYNLSQKMNGALLRLESFFLRVTFSCNHHFLLKFTGLEKTKEKDCENDAATGPIAGNVIVCFVN